ncbi:MAG: c-type cytochrome [Anaerolineae bacterium]|nr:c-type cytochrome [Anaerolineae bacterium]
MRKFYRAGLFVAIMVLVAACGTVATPRYEADNIIAEAQVEATRIIETAQAESDTVDVEAVAVEPTEAPTEIPPTESPTEIPPTEVPTEAPTEIPPTEVPTEAEADSNVSGIEAEIMAAVDTADATAGETIFSATGCAACHMTSDIQVVGPGLANVYDRAANHEDNRPEDQDAYEYVFTSIRDSQDIVVDGFPPFVMPTYLESQLSDQDIYNIMAFLEQFSDLPE